MNLFKVPCNIIPRKPIYYMDRPGSFEDFYIALYNEIMTESKKGKPVLAILDSPHRVDEFCKLLHNEYGKIKGINPAEDRNSIANAGKAGRITIATSVQVVVWISNRTQQRLKQVDCM